MANIKVGELRGLVKDIKSVEEIEYKGLKIEIKKYIPITEKIELAANIFALCLVDDDGIKLVNENSKEIAKVYFVTKYFTNITLPKDVFEAYDILINSGLYTTIENAIYDEIIKVEDILDNMIDYEDEKYYQKNKPIYVINEFLNELIEKIPTVDETEDFLKNVEKKIGDFDPDKVDFVKRFMELNSGGKNENKKQK